jgi:hypothetical protein
MGICASISSISILQDAFFHGSCALYSVFYFFNSVIEHTSLFWLQAMPSCVRVPYRTSEPCAGCSVRPPLVHTLALPLIKIARVVLSVIIRQIFLISIVCCCVRRYMSSPLTKFLRLASPEPTDPGLPDQCQATASSDKFSGTPMLVYTLLSTSRDIRSSIFVANPGHKSLIPKFGDSYRTP